MKEVVCERYHAQQRTCEVVNCHGEQHVMAGVLDWKVWGAHVKGFFFRSCQGRLRKVFLIVCAMCAYMYTNLRRIALNRKEIGL